MLYINRNSENTWLFDSRTSFSAVTYEVQTFELVNDTTGENIVFAGGTIDIGTTYSKFTFTETSDDLIVDNKAGIIKVRNGGYWNLNVRQGTYYDEGLTGTTIWSERVWVDLTSDINQTIVQTTSDIIVSTDVDDAEFNQIFLRLDDLQIQIDDIEITATANYLPLSGGTITGDILQDGFKLVNKDYVDTEISGIIGTERKTFVLNTLNEITGSTTNTATKGDVSIITVDNTSYILQYTPNTIFSNWIQILSPDSVVSVNGYSGAVILNTGDILHTLTSDTILVSDGLGGFTDSGVDVTSLAEATELANYLPLNGGTMFPGAYAEFTDGVVNGLTIDPYQVYIVDGSTSTELTLAGQGISFYKNSNIINLQANASNFNGTVYLPASAGTLALTSQIITDDTNKLNKIGDTATGLLKYSTDLTGQDNLTILHRNYADGRYYLTTDQRVLTTGSTIPQAQVSNLTSDLAGKQETLISGTNIRTIDGESLLGTGDTRTQWASSAVATHTGDLIRTLVNSFTIPANTYKQGDVVEISSMFARNGATVDSDLFIVELDGVTMYSQPLAGANRGIRGSVDMFIKTASGTNNVSHWTVNQANLFTSNTSFPRNSTINFTQDILVEIYIELGNVANLCTHIYTSISKK